MITIFTRVRETLSFVPKFILLLALPIHAGAQPIPQKNVNVIGPTPVRWLYAGNPRMQQNEPECAVSPNNPEWIACGFNDYRAVNFSPIEDAFPGIAMSRDFGKTWISGLIPHHLADTPNINQKFGADANLEALPNLLLYNFIAGWRDESQPGGVYVSRWYEHNREIGPPWEHLDTVLADIGTPGQFLDRPAFEAALHAPGTMADIQIEIPAFNDPRNLDNSHAAYTLKVPAARVHICYAVFVGNDNNLGTKINCLASDDGGATWPIKSNIAEGVEINQSVSIGTRNWGQEVLIVWRRFSDNNDTSAIMYAKSTDGGVTYSKGQVLTEICAFDQFTGPARFRTTTSPVVVSTGGDTANGDFAVYFASRNDATETCFTPAKGNKPAVPLMSPVALEDDFDRFGEPDPVDGVRQKDSRVRTALNFSRIMMVRGPGTNPQSWSDPVAVDPQTHVVDVDPSGEVDMQEVRKRGHQFMVAAEAVGGNEFVAWYDSRLDRLNTRHNPIASGYVEDLVVHFSGTDSDVPPDGVEDPPWTGMSLLPAGAYDIVPPPTDADGNLVLPPNQNNVPARRTIDIFAALVDGTTGLPRSYNLDAEFYPSANPVMLNVPSTRVTRFAKRRGANGPEQAEWNFPNGRLFLKGKASFIGDYISVAAAQFRQLEDGTWTPAQDAPVANLDLFSSLEPTAHIFWTSNRNVRGRVFYTGCDTWNPTLQMWEGVNGTNCPSGYTDPIVPQDLRMVPLQGADGGNEGVGVCSAFENFPLTRNQNIYGSAMMPDFAAHVLSARKRPVGLVNTFVVGLDNGTFDDRYVVLELPNNVLSGVDRMSLDIENPDLSITVEVPRGSSNARTIFDFGNDIEDDLQETVILTVKDCPDFDPETDESCVAPGAVLAKVPLQRSRLIDVNLPPPENVQNKQPCVIGTLTSPFATDIDGAFDPNGGTDSTFVQVTDEAHGLLAFDLVRFSNADLVGGIDLNGDFDVISVVDDDTYIIQSAVAPASTAVGGGTVDFEYNCFDPIDLTIDGEFYDLILNREQTEALLDLENLDLQNLDLENSVQMLDLQNLDLQNIQLLLDLQNLDLENLDLQNLDLQNLDLENVLLFLDLQNLDLENFELSNLDLQNALYE
jgi:uncharacterized protein YjbI with pentapeptide repeats